MLVLTVTFGEGHLCSEFHGENVLKIRGGAGAGLVVVVVVLGLVLVREKVQAKLSFTHPLKC